MVTVTEVVAPRVTELVAGRTETTVGGAGVTVMVLVALVPLRLAVICALPALLALTEMDASTWPPRTVTLFGTKATPGSLLLNATEVSVVWAELIVTVNVPDPPCVIDRVSGDKLVMVGGAGVTCTVLVTLPPLRETVTKLLPWLTAETGITTEL
jgi:hypothetical protein